MTKQLKKYRFLIAIILIFLLGLFVRLYKFDLLPFGLPHDGALEGLEAIELSQKPLPYRPYSLIGWQGESLFRYFLALLIKIFSPTVFILKLGSAIFSLLTLPAFYLLIHRIFPNIKNRSIIIFSLFFLAVSGWHIIMGKTVWRVITFPFFECLLLFFWLKFLKQPNLKTAILSGIFLALTLNTYNSARIVPLILLVWTILFIYHRKLKLNIFFKPLIIFFLTSFFLLLPLINFVRKHSQVFNSRASFLYIGNQIREQHNLQPLWNNLLKTSLIFTQKAGGDDFFVNEPLLDQPASILFIIGIIYCLYKIRKLEYQLVLTGLLINLIPGFLTIPNGNRAFGALPFVYLAVGAGAVYLIKVANFLFKRKYFVPISIFLSIWGISSLYQIYFGPHPRLIFGFNPEATFAGQYMKDRLNTTDFYLTDNFPRDTLTYLTYTGGDPYQKHYIWLKKNTDFLEIMPRTDRQTVFITLPFTANNPIIQELQKLYPTGIFQELKYNSENESQAATWIFVTRSSTSD